MLHSRSDTHLPLLPCPSFHCREKLKQVDPRFFLLFFPSPFFLPPHWVISLCLSVFLSLSSSHSSGHCMGQDGSHDRLWDDPPPPISVIYHIPRLTAASTHSHFHLCICHARQCVTCSMIY